MKAVLTLIALVMISGYYVIEAEHPVEMKSVKVEWDDTIWSIAEKNTLPGEDIRNRVWQIKKDNGITDETTLQPGDVLEVRK